MEPENPLSYIETLSVITVNAPDFKIIIGLVILIILLFGSALMSGAEVAFFSFKPEDIERFKSNKNNDARFKHNVSLLREEKLLIRVDKKQQKRRQRLITKSKISDDVNQKQLMNKSKKLGVPVGEILLAAKIQMSCN